MYQKIAAALAAAVLCMPAYAAQTKNTMKMVSYFPVPYVAYDTVSANNAMDIGGHQERKFQFGRQRVFVVLIR